MHVENTVHYMIAKQLYTNCDRQHVHTEYRSWDIITNDRCWTVNI